MKAKIVSKVYYVAETEDGKRFDVDIRNSIIKNAFDNNLEVEGEIYREEKQDRYVGGEYARSYTIRERFVPKKEKITLSSEAPNPSSKYEMKFGKGFTKLMNEVYDDIQKEDKIKEEIVEKPKRPRLHLTIPDKQPKSNILDKDK